MSTTVSKCRRHPRQVVVGVCAACLKERLLALMIEEEEYEIARNSFTSSSSMEASACMQDSPPMYKVLGGGGASSSASSFNIFTDHCKASVAPSSALRRHGLEYNREDVKHVASLYLQRHHSLSSSPDLQNPTNMKISFPFPSSLHDQADRQLRKSSSSLYKDQPIYGDQIVSASAPRKKRGSLWSLLQRYGSVEAGSSSMRKDSNVVEQPRRMSLQGNSTLYKSAYMNRGPFDVDNDDQHHLPYTAHLPHSNALGRSSKANASSLNSSPRSHRSKHMSSYASSHMLSPAPTRHCTPLISPLQMKDELTRQSENKSLPGRRHSFADDSMYDIAEDKSFRGRASNGGNKSWISSLFNPTRGKKSKSSHPSEGDYLRVYATHNPSRRQSVSASPDMAPRRKSVSFLDENVASKSPRTTSRFKMSPPKNINTDSTSTMRESDMQLPAIAKNGSAGENVCVPAHEVGGRPSGAYRLDIADNYEQQKSPTMRKASFFTKRRNSMGAMDCTRDMRVSPAPLSSSTEMKSPASYASHRNLPSMIEEDDDEYGNESNYGSVNHTDAVRKTGQHNERSSMIKLVPASMLDVEDVKESTQTDKKAMVITRKSSMSKSRSWSSTWSKTLSPMLGLRGKKKKKQQQKETSSSSSNGAMDCLKQTSINAANEQSSSIKNYGRDRHSHSLSAQKKTCHDLQHHELQQNTFDHNLSTSSCSPAMDSCSRTHYMGQVDSDSYLSSPASLLRKDYKGLINCNAELCMQVSTPKLSPNSVFTPNSACMLKRPPQQYSFLSKDYSAFSFYFSPRSSTSSIHQMISDRLRKLPTADQPAAGVGTPPRHSVDGTFPSLFRKPLPSAAVAAARLA